MNGTIHVLSACHTGRISAVVTSSLLYNRSISEKSLKMFLSGIQT